MAEQTNIGIVQGIYQAFGAGDIEAILNRLTEDVVWRDPGQKVVPHAGTWRGRDGVARFFQAVAESMEFGSFEPQEFLASGDTVVVLGTMQITVRQTGKSYDNDWAMVWRLRDGLVREWRVIEDTAVEAAAHTRG
jgi:uncharacterized protein